MLSDFSDHRTDEDMELAQLGALKALLSEVLISASTTNTAAANAQLAAKAATAAVEAIADLRTVVDTMLQRAISSMEVATASPGTAWNDTSAGARPAYLNCQCKELPLRQTWERGEPNGICEARSCCRNDSASEWQGSQGVVHASETSSPVAKSGTAAAAVKSAGITFTCGEMASPYAVQSKENSNFALAPIPQRAEDMTEVNGAPRAVVTNETESEANINATCLDPTFTHLHLQHAGDNGVIKTVSLQEQSSHCTVLARDFRVRLDNNGSSSAAQCKSISVQKSSSLSNLHQPETAPLQQQSDSEAATQETKALRAAERDTAGAVQGSAHASLTMSLRPGHDLGGLRVGRGGGNWLSSSGNGSSLVSSLIGQASRFEPDDQGPAALSPSYNHPQSLLPTCYNTEPPFSQLVLTPEISHDI